MQRHIGMDNQNNNIYSNDNVNSDDFNAGDNINVINNVNADNDINAGNRINNSASDNRVNIGDLYGMNDLRRNAQPPRKKKSQGFASGMIIGAVSAFMAVISSKYASYYNYKIKCGSSVYS